MKLQTNVMDVLHFQTGIVILRLLHVLYYCPNDVAQLAKQQLCDVPTDVEILFNINIS